MPRSSNLVDKVQYFNYIISQMRDNKKHSEKTKNPDYLRIEESENYNLLNKMNKDFDRQLYKTVNPKEVFKEIK